MTTKVTLIAVLMYLMLKFMVCEIRFAFSFFHHGASAPDKGINVESKDIIGEQWTSPGELTPSGMRMHYLLGTRNRNRWDGFISTSYNVKELYVRSTEFNRTMMSVLSNLQGLYPSGTGPKLSAGQLAKALPPVTSAVIDSAKNSIGSNALPNQIQVIPVHLMERNGPYFIYYDMFKCVPLQKLLSDNTKLKQNVDLIEKINFNWGAKLNLALKLQDESFLLNFGNMYLVVNSFISAFVDDRNLKSFTDAGISLDQFLKVAHEFEYHNIFYYYNGDPDMIVSKIIITPFIEDALRWMDTRIANDIAGVGYTGYAAPKVVLYSAHDLTLGAAQTVLAKAFNLKYLYETPFASSFIWELFRPDNVGDISKLTADDYTVKLTYNEVEYLSVKYSQFKSTLQNYLLTTEQINNFCGWNRPANELVPRSYIDATIVLSVLLFVTVVGILFLWCEYKKSDSSVVAHYEEKVSKV